MLKRRGPAIPSDHGRQEATVAQQEIGIFDMNSISATAANVSQFLR
jgi:hypothetical protein